MKYSQITVKTTTEASELIAYFLQEVCEDGVSIRDPKDLSEASWDYVDESLAASQEEEVAVSGYCRIENTDRVLCFLREAFLSVPREIAGSLAVEVSETDGDEWIRKWKENFTVLEIGDAVICPEWLTTEPSAGKKVLYLQTGVSFGTGQHETTSLCVQWMQETDLTGKKVLDVGCGSGILGLCALLFGAKSARLIDNDPQATEVAAYNAGINGLTEQCEIVCGDLVSGTDGQYDVVFANLTAEILYLLAKDLPRTVRRGSLVLLSGILSDREDKVAEAFRQAGFSLSEARRKGEWSALLMRYGA